MNNATRTKLRKRAEQAFKMDDYELAGEVLEKTMREWIDAGAAPVALVTGIAESPFPVADSVVRRIEAKRG